MDHVRNLALVGNSHRLRGSRAAAGVEALGLVHSALKCVTLPAEHVVGVSTKSASTLEAPYEGVGARSPQAVELGRIPNSLVDYLWHANRVGCWAWASVDEASSRDSVVHMRLMVGAIEVLAIPASRSD